MPKVDIALVTVIPEEYQAVRSALERHGCPTTHAAGTARQPNQYGWVVGELGAGPAPGYQLVVALAGLPGPTRMAEVVSTTIHRYNPRYVLLVGIAGGFPLDELARGDVALSSAIYDYEYGKISDEFRPRHDFTYQVDPSLLNSALALHARDRAWTTLERPPRPSGTTGVPKLLAGAIASGNKVVDNADNAFFASVLAAWPKLLAVEMEGAGAAAAIASAQSRGTIGFLMVRGVSDMPHLDRASAPVVQSAEGNKAERDVWKRYAAATAAEFTVHWILHGWPVPPARGRRGSAREPDIGTPPPDSAEGAPPGRSPAEAEALAGSSESSVWLGFNPEVTTPHAAREGRPSDSGDTKSAEARALAADLKRRFGRASAGLLRWPTTVAGDRWLERPELDVVDDRIGTERDTVTVVLGPPGSGKSAFLARLGQRLVARGVAVLAIKADQLRSAVDSAAKLAEWLDLGTTTDRAVVAVAGVEPVVVLVDQLDALADLTDLRSERLHLLLNLVQRLGGVPNVHVVCSCRAFEYRHDGRLSRLGAEEVSLQPPGWPQVAEVLAARGVSADGWPPDARELLRVPYNLSLFLNRLRGPGEHPVFTSYQQLFNDLWDEQVVRPGGGRAELLHDLAAALAEREEMWIERDWFADRRALVEPLTAADILSPTDDGFRIGFRHQSLFEFARAKAFARGGVSLAEYVLARQDALFVRPTLWMSLNYLRRASPAGYAREFDRLWHHEGLRRHVKHLLIDFLAQVEQPPPDDREQARLVAALHDPAWGRKVLAAVTGKEVWFGLLAGPHLSAEMRRPPEEAWHVVWVLVAAFGFGRDRCLELMERDWLPDDAKLAHVWQALTYLGTWDKRAVELAACVVRRIDVDQGKVWHLVTTIAESEPALAVTLVAEWLGGTRRRLTSSSDDAERNRDRLCKVLDGHNHWHGVEELAARVPTEFVLGLWPVVCAIVTDARGRPSEYTIRYADDQLWFARLDRREYVGFDSADHFFLALEAAARAFARSRPDEFGSLLRATGNPDSMLLQRLLCRGACELAPARPGAAFEFLMADRRRFWLGGLHDDLGDSRELIAAVAPHLGTDQLTRLTAAIRGWEMYRDREGADRNPDDIYARGHRFRLLSAVPTERLPHDARAVIATEASDLPEYVREARSDTGTGTGLQLIGSPVSRDELVDRTNAAIAALFDELPDATHSHHPNDWMTGGSVQLSREFEEFVKTCPDRAAAVISRLRPGEQERPAAHGVRGLVAARHPAAEIIEMVETLDARGFTGVEFRETVAFALGDLAAGGLPAAGDALLNRWRLADWPNNDRAESERNRDADRRHPTSLLWQYGGTFALPHGRFPVLYALTRSYLSRVPHAADLWLDVLLDHVEREESLTNWRAMCLYLGDVRCCSDRPRVAAFFARLFDRFPGVLASQVGARLLAQVSPLLDDEQRRRSYEAVLAWEPERGAQAFGELVCLRHLRHPEDVWATATVERAAPPVRSEAAFVGTPEEGREWVQVGIAFAAANVWRDPACRARASELLCRLLATTHDATAYAALSVFRTQDELAMDGATLALLRQIAAHPAVLVRVDVDQLFFDHLLDAFIVDPELVCRISEEAVRRRGAEFGSIQHKLFLASSALIDISLRLQRSGGDYRRRGLELFENLLDLGVAEAVNMARSNDHRLVQNGGALRSHHRRRTS